MSTKIDKREDGWYLNEERLPGIDVEAVKHYRQEGYWPNKTLGDLIEEAAIKWPERIAFVFGDKRVSFQEVNALSTRLAIGLLEIGIKPQDMVAVQLPNILEHVLAVFALGKIGAVCNTIGPVMREKEVTYVLNHCKSKAIIIPYEYHKFNHYNMVKNISSNIPSLELLIITDEVAPEEAGVVKFKTLLESYDKKSYPPDFLKKYRPDPDDISLIGFTSGTTALPKAYIHTHNTEFANTFNCELADSYSFLHKPCINLALPGFAWMYGRWCNLMTGIISGTTNVIIDPLTPENIIDTFRREKPTHIHGAPPIYRSIEDNLLSLKKTETVNLEMFHYAGSVMPYETAKKLRSLACVGTCYGLSEISPLCILNIFDPPYAQIYTSGRPAWGNKVIVVDEKNSRLKVGEEGEVAMKGPGLILGYLNQPEANNQAFFENGFFKTGDLGFFDESGYLHITGRSKDIIDRGGLKFSPREVEELILTHPKVKDAAIVGMPDPRLGEKGCVFVVLREGNAIKLEEIVNFLKNKGLATYKLPERLEVVEALPYTSTGKLQKYILREQIAKKLSEVKGR